MNNLIHMAPMAVTGLVAATIVIEKVQALYFKYSIDSKAFLGQVEALLTKGNLQGAIDLCASNEKALLPRVVKAGLMKSTRDESDIRTAFEIAILDATGFINSRIPYLAMIANIATLFGLLGTIGGLIASFEAVASADAATKQSLLASGISTSMNATALGLLVAIPVMIAYSVLNAKANRILDEIDKGAGRTLGMLHGRLYMDSDDDYSKISFEGVQDGERSKIKGAA